MIINPEEMYGSCTYANSLTITEQFDFNYVNLLFVYPNFNFLKVLIINRVKTDKIKTILESNYANLLLLNLDYNGIDEIIFEHVPNLKTVKFLSCGHNTLTRIKRNSINIFFNLEQLNLSYNLIDVIESESFRNQTKLQVLSLKNNKITSVDEHSFIGLHNLAELDLSHNFMKSLELVALRHLNSLSKFTFDLGKMSVRLKSMIMMNNLENLDSISNYLDYFKTGDSNSDSQGVIAIDFKYLFELMKNHEDQNEKLKNLKTLQRVTKEDFDLKIKIWIFILTFLLLDLTLALSISIRHINNSFAVSYGSTYYWST